jgi:hypothetical protein
MKQEVDRGAPLSSCVHRPGKKKGNQAMTEHAHLVPEYRRIREVRFRLSNQLVKTIPKQTLENCARELGLFHRGTLVFDSEAEMHILMDYCLYRPDPDGRNLVAKHLEKLAPREGSDESAVLRSMLAAYYSIIEIDDVERGVGLAVRDIFRDQPGFLVDIGLGTTAQRGWKLATRIVPADGFLTTAGTAIPLDAATAKRVFNELASKNWTREKFDFTRMTPDQEAEFAATIIVTALAGGTSSRISYAEPGSRSQEARSRRERRRVGRNDPCPCGSNRKYKFCCGINA